VKILLAEHYGICFGVRDAVAQAEALAAEGPLTILGQLVHNPIVHQRLLASGAQEGSVDHLEAPSQKVLITAHGASTRRKNAWARAGFDVEDSTCPLVHHAHEQLRRLVEAAYHPVVIGQMGHVEVRGLTEDFPGSSVVGHAGDVALLPPSERYGVISQTTQPIDHVHAMVEEIRRCRPSAEVRFVDTVCKPTKDRQSALQKLIRVADVIVVVGGRESNNTRQLVLACRAVGRHAMHIERPEELIVSDFQGIGVVGLTAGTSTLPETVAAVRARLEQISAAQRSAP
jgi:4-hydroxy-3-methylbut-2-en-1-yl diphosphate reductase